MKRSHPTRVLSAALVAASLLVVAGCAGPRTSFDSGDSIVLSDDSGVALGGYDAVSYFSDGGPVRGREDLTVEHGGATYRFATEAHREAFAADPERYAPAYGGWCAWAVADGTGALVEVDPRSYVVQDGRLLLFYDGFLADTRAWWLGRDPQELAGVADANWSRIEKTAVR